MNELFAFTRQDLIVEVRREIALRETVYPRMIQQRRLDPRTAERRLSLMRAVLRALKETHGKEQDRIDHGR